MTSYELTKGIKRDLLHSSGQLFSTQFKAKYVELNNDEYLFFMHTSWPSDSHVLALNRDNDWGSVQLHS